MGRLFGNLNIKAKVLVGLAGVLVIMVVISGMAIWSFTSAKGKVEAYSQRVKVVSLAGELDRDVLELRLHARDYGLTGMEEDALKVKSIAELVRRDIAAALTEIKDTERHQRVEDISRRFDEYMHNFDRIQAQLSEQRRLIRDVMDPSGSRFQKEITALQDLAARSGTDNVAALAQSALEHGLLARLYANQMIGRRDALLGPRANAEFQTLSGLIANLEGAVTADAQQRVLNEIKVLVPQYRAAFQRVEELSNSSLDLVDRVNAGIATKFAEDAAFIRESGIEDERRIEEEVRSFIDWSGNFIIALALTGLGFGGIVAWLIGGAIARPVVAMTRAMVELANGKLDIAVPGLGRGDEIGRMAGAVHVFKESAQRLNAQSWIKTNIAEVSIAMQTAETARDFAQTVIGRLVQLLEGGAGVFHIWNPEVERLELLGSWGFRERKHLPTSYKLGEGLVGQCALEKTPILLSGIPDDYIRISSGLGDAPPRTILVVPIVSKNAVLGVVEIATFSGFTATQQTLIDELLPAIALNFEILDRNRRTRHLLEKTQEQAQQLLASEEELRAQSEELQTANKELHLKSDTLQRQTEELRASEEELRAQREELQATNEELAEKGSALEERQKLLETARQESERRAAELGMASRYKSEFLANMSHELRTPLNSLLILAKSLTEEANLSEDQIDSARIIHESGSHLLRLINDILDLSKVEAGKMELVIEDIPLADFTTNIHRRFSCLAESKGLSLAVEADPGLPPAMRGDLGKMEQIVNNLVGNAIKFTRQGGVSVRLSRLGADADTLAIAVSDTGVGVPADKLERIFRAFEQADGTTSRQFGGTGLGLSISLRLAQLQGGGISVSSVEGEGSTFTLSLPLSPPLPANGGGAIAIPPTPISASPISPSPISASPISPAPGSFADDRVRIEHRDEVMLVIEDDDAFARILCDLSRKRGFKCVRAADGKMGLELAALHRPTGILLDIGLPELDGWSVMSLLKQNPATRHIPVHVISGADDNVRGLQLGAVGYLKKPIDKVELDLVFDRLRHFAGDKIRRVLVVDDDSGSRKATSVLVRDDKVEIVEAGDGKEALELLRTDQFDCVILDLMLPDISGFDLLDRASEMKIALPPVVVYSGKELSYEENLKLRKYTDSIVIKGVRSPERLVDEVGLFLHRVQSGLPVEQQQAMRAAPEKESSLAGRTVLVVDDDMRNAFALSKVLRAKGLTALLAQDGHKALAQLDMNPRIDIVLMDIMMPIMDGYTTIQEIRKQARFERLPIIALTAKAMPGDRERCLEAGANDYASKPVDVDQLVVAMRALLSSEVVPA